MHYDKPVISKKGAPSPNKGDNIFGHFPKKKLHEIENKWTKKRVCLPSSHPPPLGSTNANSTDLSITQCCVVVKLYVSCVIKTPVNNWQNICSETSWRAPVHPAIYIADAILLVSNCLNPFW